MSRRAPRPLSVALAQLAGELAPATTLARVQQIWQQAAGIAISEAGRPTAERDGVLTITCSDAVWAQELDLMSTEIIRCLNQVLGEGIIRSLRCRTG
jgi:predicted nucleic acid-binding Zn ribbon protein